MLSPDLIPVWSGIGSYVYSLLKHLPSEVEVQVLTTKRKIQSGSGIFQIEEQNVQDLFPSNVKIHFISSAENTFSYHLQFQLACLRFFPKLHKENRFSFVHTNFPLMSELLLQLAKRINIPVLSTIHTTIEGQHFAVRQSDQSILKMQQSDLANLFLMPTLHIAEEVCLKHSTKLMSSSYYMRSELQSHFSFLEEQEIPVVHYGIDTDLFSPRKDPNLALLDLTNNVISGRQVVLFTGRLVASKGIDILVKAIPKVLKEVPDALFLFAGGGDPTYYIKLLRENSVPDDSFRFIGYVHYLNMPDLYSLADVFVMPTLYESFPLRLLESMACKKAIVASDTCGIPEIIKPMHNGVLVPPRNVESLAEALTSLLQDRSLRLKLGKNAEQTISDGFSAEVMTSKTLDIYKNLY